MLKVKNAAMKYVVSAPKRAGSVAPSPAAHEGAEPTTAPKPVIDVVQSV